MVLGHSRSAPFAIYPIKMLEGGAAKSKSISCHKDSSSVDQYCRNATLIRICDVILVIAAVALMYGGWRLSQYVHDDDMATRAARARPSLFIRLIGVEGLDPRGLPPVPPAFHLTVDAEGVPRCYRSCNGGNKSMLRISYHGIILAWGHVPWFCIDGNRRVATVEARAEAAVLREDVRGLIQSEQHVVGKTEFDVEGEVAGLGYLSCKVFLLQGKASIAEDSKAPCRVEYY
ncbi:hypothetical protein U9M48_011208 [Paspalum notatum var. saurae]|uniref:Late embryogenesis abundant protein LEA-2 subgroup domain-containing protein n=1 Tax=Paspalum notatum var. saurae TaxID=547442 RepID=A0AAQ3SV61_PASNO